MPAEGCVLSPQGEDNKSSMCGTSPGFYHITSPLPILICILSPVINRNHEYNNCQWVLWVFFMNYQTWRWFWGPSELGVAIRCKDYSLYFSVGLKLYALPQQWKENLKDILRKNPVAFDHFPQISQQPHNTFFIYSSSFSSLYHSPMCALFSPKKCLFLMQVIFPISLYFWILHIHHGISLSY